MNSHSYDTCDGGVCSGTVLDAGGLAAAIDALPGPGPVASITQVFAALADPTRLRILLALRARELCVCDLAAVAGVSQSGASHQLRMLRQLRLVAFRREGKMSLYRLADDHVATLVDVAGEHAAELAGEHDG